MINIKYRGKVLILIIIMIFSLNLSVKAEDSKEIDLSISSSSVSFYVDKLVPGDWITREIVLKNNGQQDFEYVTSSRLTSGSEKLYNALELSVKSGEKTLYSGSLGDFKKIEPRMLKSTNQENLRLIITMPHELGNDFQGLSSEFEFEFYAEGNGSGVIPVTGDTLPQTATNLFQSLFVGAIMMGVGIILYRIQSKNRIDIQG